MRNKCSETLPGRAFEFKMDGIFRKSVPAMAFGDFASNNGTNHPVNISDWKFSGDRCFINKSRFADIHQGLNIEGVFKSVILFYETTGSHFFVCFRLVKN